MNSGLLTVLFFVFSQKNRLIFREKNYSFLKLTPSFELLNNEKRWFILTIVLENNFASESEF